MPPPALSLQELSRATLARQGLLAPLPATSTAQAVSRLGSLQAQHPEWPSFALATRLRPSDPAADLRAARERREVVRASLMRITVHVVATVDAWAMATVSLPFRRAQWRTFFKADPATSPLGRRILAAHGAVLAEMRQRPLRITEIDAILRAELSGTEIPGNRCLWRHFSAFVPLAHVPHQGEAVGRSRYVPFDQWIGPATPDQRDEETAATTVARGYLAAFGPASVDDLAAYVGRGRDLPRWRRAMEQQKDLLRFSDPAGRELLDLADAPRPSAARTAPPRLLARWDSLLLAYGTRDRTRVLPEEHRSRVITRNADVLPTFLLDGVVAGTWLPRRDERGHATAELRPFGRLAASDRAALEEEAERLLPTLGTSAFARYPGSD